MNQKTSMINLEIENTEQLVVWLILYLIHSYWFSIKFYHIKNLDCLHIDEKDAIVNKKCIALRNWVGKRYVIFLTHESNMQIVYIISILFTAELDKAISLMKICYSVFRNININCKDTFRIRNNMNTSLKNMKSKWTKLE